MPSSPDRRASDTTLDLPPASAQKEPSLALLLALMAMMFLSAMEVTIVSTAMPKVVGAIGGMDLYPWVFTSFMLASTVIGPFYGKFADLFGVRRLMFGAIALFVLGSALCGLAATMPQLVVFRAVQGFGAGGIMVLIMTAFGQLYSAEKRGQAMGYVSVVWGVAGLVGPFLGGVIVSLFAWPWIFWVNVPAGLVAVFLIAKHYPRHDLPAHSQAFDWIGGALLTLGILSLMLAASVPGGGFAWGWLLGPLALAAFVWQESRAAEPLLPLSPFKRPAFSLPMALLFLASLALITIMTYVPLLIQNGLGRSPAESGAALMPMMLLWPLASALSGRAVNRFGFRRLMVLGAALICLGYGLLALPIGKSSSWGIAAEAGLVGMGMGILSTLSTIATQAAVPRRQLGIASSTSGLARSLGQTLGLGILGGLQLQLLASQMRGGGPGSEALAMASSITVLFVIAFCLSVILLVLSFGMSPLPPKELAQAEGHGP